MLPDFFILGAPKCGTTSLATWLGEHPQIFFSPVKEPFFFNTDHKRNGRRSRADYESLFEAAGPEHKAIGEGTVWYLYSKDAVPNIERETRAARYIVCLRNPIEMAPSLFHEMRFNGGEPLPTFEEAWDAQERRASEAFDPVGVEPDFLQYGRACSLGAQLQRLYGWVGQDRVHLVFLDDMSVNPARELARVLAFLGVPPIEMPLGVVNARKSRKSHALQRAVRLVSNIKYRLGFTRSFGVLSRVSALNAAPGTAEPLPEPLRQRLCEYFDADIRLLSRLTGRDLDHWR